MFSKYEQIAISSNAKDYSAFTPPNNYSHAQLQADTAGGIRYTMDGTTVPTTSAGMRLLNSTAPETFTADELRNIKFIRDGNADTNLNVHYFTGRTV